MRKVVSYCKRHLAQEEHMKNEKSPEELAKTKSTLSLKNWVSSCRKPSRRDCVRSLWTASLRMWLIGCS